MARLILIRHGETEDSRAARYSGQRDTPLTLLGEAQHARVRAHLAGEEVGRVVCSDLQRCRHLAGLLAADHGPAAEPLAALREASFGAWEGLTYAEALEADRPAMVAFNRDQLEVAPPGGETLAGVAARAGACLATLLREHRRRPDALIVVSHGGTLRALLCGLLEIPLRRHWTLRSDHAALSVLDIYPQGPVVAVLNDTCHLREMRHP
jgi:alpha-ribazole phosphatase